MPFNTPLLKPCSTWEPSPSRPFSHSQGEKVADRPDEGVICSF